MTPSEQKMLDIIREVGPEPIDTRALVPKFYDKQEVPIFAQHVVSGICRSLALKGKIKRTPRQGPHAIRVWIP